MLNVKTVTVIGANGTMGRNIAAIFASFGNAKVYMVSRDLKKSEKAKDKAFRSVRAESITANLIPADYSMLEECVKESDIVFESTAENWETKNSVTDLVAAAAEKYSEECKDTLFCTGTSGLSITKLSERFSEKFRKNYMGMHFFNPPYSLTLCELTPTKYSDRELFEAAKDYCANILFRTVIEVKDSPAFLGNRIGFQFINKAMRYADIYQDNGGIDYIDAILGAFTGRSMAPIVTANFVGLDVHKAIVDNIYENTDDFAHEDFILSDYAQKLIDDGMLGRKAGGGLYKTEVVASGVKLHLVYDISTGNYRKTMKYTFPFKEKMIALIQEADYDDAFHILKTNKSQEAKICRDFLINYVLYSLRATELVGYDIHAADDAIASGFSWCPPLAMIEAFGGVDEFRALCKANLTPEEIEKIDVDHLLSRVEPSKYDYRRFVRAKY